MGRRRELKKQDGGLDPKTVARLRAAIRQVWIWTSHARRLCLRRALIKDGFSRCEECNKKVPKVYADHLEPCGELDAGFFERLFCSSAELQAICKKCHSKKTALERQLAKYL